MKANRWRDSMVKKDEHMKKNCNENPGSRPNAGLGGKMDTQSIPSNSSALVDDLFLDEDALEEVEGVAAGEAEEVAWRGKVPQTAGGGGMILPSTGIGSSRTSAM